MAGRQTWHAIPVLGVRSVRKAAEYYRDILGFQLDPERGVFDAFGSEPEGVYAIVERSGAEIHFQIRRGELPGRRRESIERDVYIHVPDVDALHAELAGRGATLAGPPTNAPYGLREIEVRDPDGFRITFGAPL